MTAILIAIGTFLGNAAKSLKNAILGSVPSDGDTLGKLYDKITALQQQQGSAVTQQDIQDAIAAVVDGSPAAFDTLKEIVDQMQQDETALSGLLTTVGNKVNASDLGTAQDFQDAYDTAFNS